MITKNLGNKSFPFVNTPPPLFICTCLELLTFLFFHIVVWLLTLNNPLVIPFCPLPQWDPFVFKWGSLRLCNKLNLDWWIIYISECQPIRQPGSMWLNFDSVLQLPSVDYSQRRNMTTLLTFHWTFISSFSIVICLVGWTPYTLLNFTASEARSRLRLKSFARWI